MSQQRYRWNAVWVKEGRGIQGEREKDREGGREGRGEGGNEYEWMNVRETLTGITAGWKKEKS